MTVREPANGALRVSPSSSSRAKRQSVAYPGAPVWTPNQPDATLAQGTEEAKVYPHIKDLQAEHQKIIRGHSAAVPIRTLLGAAQDSANRVHTDVTYKRPDLAFIQYLVSSEILINLIPRHKDFPSIRADQGRWSQRYTDLCKQNHAQNDMFKEIKAMLVENNITHGTQPASESSTNGAPRGQAVSPRPASLPGPLGKGHQDSQIDPSRSRMYASSPPPPLSYEVRSQPRPQVGGDLHREKPIVYSKPNGLHSSPVPRHGVVQTSTGDPLSQRFSQLRIQQKVSPARQDEGSPTVNDNRQYQLPSPSNLQSSSSSISSVARTHSRSSSVDLNAPSHAPSLPSGPRAMPLPPKVPAPPPKIPLKTNTEISLPQAPAPAYDPSKSTLSPIKSPLSSSSTMINAPATEQSSVRSTEPIYQTRQTSITAGEFYEKLRTTTVLVVDVRSRAEFDDGHVLAKCIICIEPFGLSSGISAEELEDRLVVSPEAEQILFEKRNEFDLIVYYDQSTKSDNFLKGAPTRTEANSLRALHDTLYEFNDYKPLRRPPVVLAGGLEAWMDFVGPQALATSKTAGLIGSTSARQGKRKVGRPISRVPKASANSSLEVRKRRLREQNALNPDEERKWLEKARNEEVNPADYQNAQSDGDRDARGDEPPSPFIHSYEDFLRRFPEPLSVQQSMINSGPLPLTIPPPPSLPPPPARQAPSQPAPPPLPSIPSRPAPALPRPSYSGVSEQQSQSSPLSRQASSSQYPLFTPRPTARALKLPRTGLVNFGVTCYMNATVQCLLATIPVSQLFLDNRWRDYSQKNWKGSNGILPEIFANLIRSLWCDDCTAIRPSSMRKLCGSLNQEWAVDRQQDAKEFFDFVVDCLHEDLNANWDRTPLRPLTLKEEMHREHMPVRLVSEVEWRRYSHREQSPISDFFAGQHASRLQCTTCKNTSTTYEAFYSISVEIPRSPRKQGWDIHDCLRSYTQEERLSKEEMWKCPYCKCEREATKQITITRAPMFLVVHFKRFEMRKGESAKKVHTPIHFPLVGLDMSPYTLPAPTARDLQLQQQADPTHEHIPELATTGPYLYDAYAVMRHLGSSGNGGHYISLVRDASRGCWRKFDDDRVMDFDPTKLKSDQRLQNEQAYILFYCRAPPR